MCHFSQIQIVATCLNARNVPSIPGIPPREVEAAWKPVKDMLVVLIDETRAADESMRTYITDDGESGDWLTAASSASSRSINKSSSNIADEEIALWRMRLQELPSHKNPLHELRPLQWFHGLPSWVEKFSLYLPLLLPQSARFLRLVIL